MTHYHMYVASCDRDGGIHHFELRADGTAEPLGFTPMDRPMYMTASNGSMHVVLRDPADRGESGLISYTIASDGSLTEPSPVIPTRGTVACHVAVVGGRPYAVNYGSGSVFGANGAFAQHSGSSVHPTRQTAPHTHFVGAAPDGQHLLVTDLGTDSITVYDPALNAISSARVPAGHGARHLALHADGKHVFCANELASTVSTFVYENATLRLIDTASMLPADFDGESTAAAIRCVGETVYASNRGHDSVAVLDFADGKLTLRHTIPTHGSHPRDIWVEGNLLIATNQFGNNVTVTSLSEQRLLSALSVKTPLCVVVLPWE